MNWSYHEVPRAPPPSPSLPTSIRWILKPADLPSSSSSSFSLSLSQSKFRSEEGLFSRGLLECYLCVAINTPRGGWEPEQCGTHERKHARRQERSVEIIPKHLHKLQAAEIYESLSVDYNQCAAVASNFTKNDTFLDVFPSSTQRGRERRRRGGILPAQKSDEGQWCSRWSSKMVIWWLR